MAGGRSASPGGRLPAVKLTVANHDRDVLGMTYVYPVVSRRARGLSIGVNLNPNNACNWRCVYCQVPGLVAGKGPVLDLDLLESELRGMLEQVLRGDYFERAVPPEFRRLHDVAFSGNGEPTSSPSFGAAVDTVGRVIGDFDVPPDFEVVLITNGSLANKPTVLDAIGRLGALRGVVWFKLDAATVLGAERVNSKPVEPERHLERLEAVANICPTWIQTCLFAMDGAPPSDTERAAYLDAIERLSRRGVPLRGVLLYGLARPSHQPEAPRLSKLPAEWLEALSREIEQRGVKVQLHV